MSPSNLKLKDDSESYHAHTNPIQHVYLRTELLIPSHPIPSSRLRYKVLLSSVLENCFVPEICYLFKTEANPTPIENSSCTSIQIHRSYSLPSRSDRQKVHPAERPFIQQKWPGRPFPSPLSSCFFRKLLPASFTMGSSVKLSPAPRECREPSCQIPETATNR